MTSPIEKQQPSRALAHARAVAADAAVPCDLLKPAGLACALPQGHDGVCEPAFDTEPPASDPIMGSAPAASVVPEPEPVPAPAAPRSYSFKRRNELDIETPSGGFVRVRQLSTSQVIELGVLNMKDAFGADLLRNLEGDDIEAAVSDAEQWAADPVRSQKVLDTLNRVLVAAVVCPAVVVVGDSTDEQMNVADIEMSDKFVIFDAAMPDEMKAAAQGAQQKSLKSLRR